MYGRFASAFTLVLFVFNSIAYAETIESIMISMSWEESPANMDAREAIEQTAKIINTRLKTYQGDLFFELKEFSDAPKSNLGTFELKFDNTAKLNQALPILLSQGNLGFYPVRFTKMDYTQIRSEIDERVFADDYGTFYVVDETQAVVGDIVALATIRIDNQSKLPILPIKFRKDIAASIGKLTVANIGKKIVIAIDDELQSTPIVRTAIWGSTMEINGLDANGSSYAILLNNGTLPIAAEILE